MKRNAITRIIIFSIVIVLLLGVLLTGLGLGMFMIDFDITDSGYTTAQAPTVLFSPEEVKNIQIEWASGRINIQTGDVDAINITENGSYSDQQAMTYKQSGDTVYIRYQKDSIKIGFFSATSKDLTVTVPKDWICGELAMDVASAEVTINAVTAQRVDVDTASGDYQFISCDIGDLDIDTASGSIKYGGTLNSLDCDAASGRFVGIFSNTPKSIQMDSASGDLDITLPENAGFRVNMEALSGHFDSDFPTNVVNGSYVCNNGDCEIDFDGLSGSICIRKGS